VVPRLERRLQTRFSYALVRSGHYVQLDRPREVTDRLVAFVTEV
jgi:hypothetical protein